jgi:hypothetical protein
MQDCARPQGAIKALGVFLLKAPSVLGAARHLKAMRWGILLRMVLTLARRSL